MRSRIATTSSLCLLLVALVLVAPPAGADAAAPAGPALVERLPGLRSGPEPLPGEPGPAGALAAPGARVRQSLPTLAPLPFSLVGLEVPQGAIAWLRTSADGRSWSEWTTAEVDPDEGPDPGQEGRAAHSSMRREPGTHISAPLWVGAARHVQTRVVGAAPEDVAVHLVDSAGLSRSFGERAVDAVRAAWSSTPQAAAAPAAPVVVTRAEWGADESLNRDEPSVAPDGIRFGVVHHTAGSNDYSRAEAPAIVRGIHAYHVQSQGWSDIGYNFLVDKYGTVYEGRAGGVEEAVIGAHAGGFNTNSFGASLIGDFSTLPPPAAAIDALTDLLAWKYDVHHVDVTRDVSVTSSGSTRYEDGREVVLRAVSGHRDVSSTACPATLYDALPGLRDQVVTRQGEVLLEPRATPEELRVVSGRSLDGEVTLSTGLRPAGDWRLEVRAPDGTLVHSDSGSGDTATSTWSPGDLPRGDLPRGQYTATFSGGQRRPAEVPAELVPPIPADVAVTPPAVRLDSRGDLSEPVRFTAVLWPGADWTLTVRGPDGSVAHQESGTGETLDVTWSGPAVADGTHTFTIDADDVEPFEGTVEVLTGDALTRVGDQPGPVAGAVGLSQTAFPAPLSAERAVLVRGDVFADAITAGPLAGEDGPVLLTGREALDPKVRDELARVLPPGKTIYVLGGDGALAPAVADELSRTWRVERLFGAERTATAARVADEVVARTGATTALIARSGPDDQSPWADALAGGAYGADRGMPVLLTGTETLSAPITDAILRLGITQTVVLGGVDAVSAAAEAALPGARRVFGDDRAATSARVAQELWGKTAASEGDRIVLVDGYRPDAWTLALAATPLSARDDAPLLVAGQTALPDATGRYLDELGYGPQAQGSGWVVGDDKAIGQAVADDASARLR